MRRRTTGNNTKKSREAETQWTLKLEIPELFPRTSCQNLGKLLGMKSVLNRMGTTKIQERQGPNKRGERNRTKKLHKPTYHTLEHFVEPVYKGGL